jgi:hypothetical protein
MWIATGLLAGSWVLGVDHVQPVNTLAWAATIVIAVALMAGVRIPTPRRWQAVITLGLCVPAIWLLDVPYKVVPLLLALGLLLQFAVSPRTWPRFIGRAAIAASSILLVQAFTMELYAGLTARRHELVWPLSDLVGATVQLVGIECVVDRWQLVVRSAAQTFRIGLTWELPFDPASVCFVTGGLVMLSLVGIGRGAALPSGRRRLRGPAMLLGVAFLWSLMRAALLVAIIVHRLLRVDAVSAVNVGQILVNGWLQLGLVLCLSLLVALVYAEPARTKQKAGVSTSKAPIRLSKALIGTSLVTLGVCGLAVFVQWQPLGLRKAGRILVVEKHSTWEPTTQAYSTKSYGEKGSYNYGALYAYFGQFYRMSRLLESETIDDETLQQCDVLLIKTPTARYSSDEVNAVVRFVRGGGSLLLIGDHTNVFNMNTHLNDIARRFGFTFRNDLLFQVGDPYRQTYRPPRVPHPCVQYFRSLDFAVSCSIDPGLSAGNMVIRGSSLYSLPPAYHESNYHPQAEYRTDMQYGAWCQLWATTCGRGRVLGFTDSTLFSNFCIYQPAKTELALGMLEWLNHTSVWDVAGRRITLVLVGILASVTFLALGWWLGTSHGTSWLLLMAASLAAWSLAGQMVKIVHREAMRRPIAQDPLPHVVIDRTVSEVPLSTGAFSDGPPEDSYGLLEQWIPRLGCVTSRETGADVTSGDAMIVICPNRSVTAAYRQRLTEFVQSGGDLFVLDSPENAGSTANSLLNMFGLESHQNLSQTGGQLDWAGDRESPKISLPGTPRTITGGTPIAFCQGASVAAQLKHGEGTVTAVGFGSLFNDANMGQHWLAEPDAATLDRYAVLYALLELAFDLKYR